MKHWTEADFVLVFTKPAYDGSNAVNRFGYCRKCGADMQCFAEAGKPVRGYQHTRSEPGGDR